MGRLTRTTCVLFAAALCLLPLARACGAGTIFEGVSSTSAAAFGMDPSARSLGMGGASGAVFWGADPDHWANPALLGTTRGVRYEDADRDLTLDGDPFFRFHTRRLALGYGGVGLALAGRPFSGLGGLRLEYPTITVYGPDGPEPTITMAEQVRSWSVGLSLASLATSLAGWRGQSAPRFTRWGDLAIGYSEKHDEFLFDGESFTRTTGRDLGVLGRVGGTLRGPAGAGLRLEGAYGLSVLNFTTAEQTGEPRALPPSATEVGAPAPAARGYRNALAARAALAAPAAWLRRVPSWLVPPDPSLLAIGGAWDLTHTTGATWDGGDYDLRFWGVEADLAGVLQLRFGGRTGGMGTLGFGVGLPVGRLGGFRYDHARADIGMVGSTQSGWTAWVDPIAILRTAR